MKTWTTLGVAIIGSAGVASAAPMMTQAPVNPLFYLTDGESEGAEPPPAPAPAPAAEGGEGAEGGSEGGGMTVDTYLLNSSDPNAFAYDGKAAVAGYANHVYESYEAAEAGAKDLQAAVAALLDKPGADTLKAAREAWVKARPAYLRTEAFRFYDGPIEAVEGDINSWPMNEAYIDYVQGDGKSGLINTAKDEITAESLAAINQKEDEADVTTGWHAIEFLLWGQDLSATGPGDRPFTDYVAGQGNNDRRRDYLKVVTGKLVDDLEGLEQAWAPGKDNYRATFEKLEQREALGRIINGMAVLAGFEFMSERLGVALDSGDQEDEHSCFSDTTKQDFVYDLDGIKQVWAKTGLAELVASRDKATADQVTALLADAEAKIAKLGDPWDQVLAAPKDSQPRKDAEDVVTALQALADGIKTAGNKLGVLVLIPSG